MINHCRSNGNPRPIFEEKSGAFVITFIKPINEGTNEGINEGTNEGINEGINEGTNEGINRLYAYMKNHEGLRVNQISEALNIPSKTLERWISSLKSDNKIEYHGSKKTGGYFVVK
jgi:ATP-dependent DNA helicase RecG